MVLASRVLLIYKIYNCHSDLSNKNSNNSDLFTIEKQQTFLRAHSFYGLMIRTVLKGLFKYMCKQNV